MYKKKAAAWKYRGGSGRHFSLPARATEKRERFFRSRLFYYFYGFFFIQTLKLHFYFRRFLPSKRAVDNNRVGAG
jgi:hypothetical protein